MVTKLAGTAALFGFIALGLGACADPKANDALTTGSIDADGYRTRHPIVLAESAETIDIPVSQQSTTLTTRMAHTVTVFAQEARSRGASVLTIMVPNGSANQLAARKLAVQITNAISAGGFPRSAISRAPYAVDDGTASPPIRISYPRIKAMVTHRCGLWSNSAAAGNFDNQDDWELGCATQTNLAAMVANPEDLVTPTGEDPVDGTRRTTIITKYRSGEQTKADTGAKGATVAGSVQGGN